MTPKLFYSKGEQVNINLSLGRAKPQINDTVYDVVVSAKIKDVKKLYIPNLFISEIIWQDTVKLKIGETVSLTLPDSILNYPIDAFYEFKAELIEDGVVFGDNTHFFYTYGGDDYEEDSRLLKTTMTILKDSVEIFIDNTDNRPVWYTLAENEKIIAYAYSEKPVKAKYKKSKDNYRFFISYLWNGKMYMNYIEPNFSKATKITAYNQPFSFSVNENSSVYNKNKPLEIGSYPESIYNPKFNGAIHTIELEDTCSSIIPAVIYENNSQIAQLVWVDDNLVYDCCADNVNYQIPIKAGKHNIRLRAAIREIHLRDFEIKDSTKTFLYVNADSLIKINPWQSIKYKDTDLPKRDSEEVKKQEFLYPIYILKRLNTMVKHYRNSLLYINYFCPQK